MSSGSRWSECARRSGRSSRRANRSRRRWRSSSARRRNSSSNSSFRDRNQISRSCPNISCSPSSTTSKALSRRSSLGSAPRPSACVRPSAGDLPSGCCRASIPALQTYAGVKSRRLARGFGEADMIPASFEYAVARDVADAIQLLASSGGEGKVLAGGQSLIPLMKFRLAQPALLIDINRVTGLGEIRENGELRIGALVREADLEANAIVRQRYPILVDTTQVIADPIVRNLATVGGNLAHADPANDHPATMLALRASVVAQGPKGERVISIDDFFLDTFTTALRPDEILIEIRIPKPAARSGGAYLKLERKVGDFAIVGVAAMVRLDESGKIAAASIGLTNVGLTAIRARRAEETLRGQAPDDKAFAAAGAAGAPESQPVSDLRGPADYKRDVVRVMTQRAIRKAVARAKGGN